MIKAKLKVLDARVSTYMDEGLGKLMPATEIIVEPITETIDGNLLMWELSLLGNFGFTVYPATDEYREGDIIELTLNNTTPHEPERVELNPTERTNEDGNE